MTAKSPIPPFLNNSIIILDILLIDYSFLLIKANFKDYLASVICPACLVSNNFLLHGSYYKYYYKQPIIILRVRCSDCGTTHALIPSFSLPDTSIGTAEAEEYLRGRHQGKSRKEAGKGLLKKGASQKYLIQLENMLNARIAAFKALIVNFKLSTGYGVACLDFFLKTAERPVFSLNQLCLAFGFNAVFCSRAAILLFKKKKSGKCISLNLGTSSP